MMMTRAVHPQATSSDRRALGCGIRGAAFRAMGGLLLPLLVLSCASDPDPERIIERSIEAHGVDALSDAKVTFDFRGRQFAVTHQNGWFRQERRYEADGAHVREVLTNEGTFREIDGAPVPLTDSERSSVETGVNSVLYFAFLPFRLDDPAVIARYLGEEIVDGERYDRVEVTFRPEDGGRDWEDRFLYWFHQGEGTLDYLAYLYHVGDGGTRFRRAVNRRLVDGLVVQDHENFVAPGTDTLEDYGRLYEEGALEWVSDIELENVRVEPPPEGFPDDAEAPRAPATL